MTLILLMLMNLAVKPNEFISQCKFTLMLRAFQLLPRPVDVRKHSAFTWSVWLLIVCPHLALNGEEQHLKIAFLHKPASNMLTFKYPQTTRCSQTTGMQAITHEG